MSQKRQPEEEGKKKGSGSASPTEKRQRVPAFKEVVMEAVKMHQLQKLLSTLEPLVRRVVREEVEQALKTHLNSLTRQCGKQIHPSTSRSLQLQFRNKLSLPIFTGTKIEGEDSLAVNIALVDGMTGQIVDSGPESSMKVEIVVLEGDFEGNEEENWSFEEFKNNIVREREGKRPLLSGDLVVDLNEGTGVVGEISFTDNSSWTRGRKFRLGAKVVDGYLNEVRVREAKSEAFMVKDHRGELYKKHYPPSLFDEVWRLEKIGKDGALHKRLSSENINSVKDFLTLLATDAVKLRNILGNSMSAKMWEMTVEHARTCVIPTQMYVYFADHNTQTKAGAGVVFNIVGEVFGLLSQHQFIDVNDLSESEKADANGLVKLALEHWHDVVTYNSTVNTGSSYPDGPTSFLSPCNTQAFQDNNYINNFGPSPINEITSAAPGATFDFGSPPDIYTGCNIQSSLAPETREKISNPLMLDECVGSETLSFSGEDSLKRYLISDLGVGAADSPEKISNPLMLDECVGSETLLFSGEDSLKRYLISDLGVGAADSPADLGTAVTGFLAMSARSAAARYKANTVWGTLVSVLRWRFSIKKIVARKRKVHQKERFG